MQNKMWIIFAVSSSIIFAVNVNDASAVELSNITSPKIITDGDLYIKSKIPTQVSFNVVATDSLNKPIPVECNKTLNTIFKTGKTTVRCMAVDSFGNEVRDSFVVTVGYEIVQIPDWFKQTAKFWASQTMSDDEYIQTIDFLIDEQIIHIPQTKTPKDKADSNIPMLIKTNAEKWGKGEMSDDEFSIGIQWMLNQGMIQNQSNKI